MESDSGGTLQSTHSSPMLNNANHQRQTSNVSVKSQPPMVHHRRGASLGTLPPKQEDFSHYQQYAEHQHHHPHYPQLQQQQSYARYAPSAVYAYPPPPPPPQQQPQHQPQAAPPPPPPPPQQYQQTAALPRPPPPQPHRPGPGLQPGSGLYRSHSVDPPIPPRPAQQNMRPKLTVQIPNESSSSVSSAGETPKSANGRNDAAAPNSKEDFKAPTSASSTSSNQNNNNSNNSSSTNSANHTNGNTSNNGPSLNPPSGGPWGSSLTLPPPSPSSYLNPANSVGPGNPFNRPAPPPPPPPSQQQQQQQTNNNGEQTPLSAALPSKYVNDLLPSPSNFYSNTDWSIHFGQHQQQQQQQQQSAGGSQLPHPSTLHPNQRHLASSNDMLPSPLQFNNTPVNQSSNQNFSDERKRPDQEPNENDDSNNAKRIKLER